MLPYVYIALIVAYRAVLPICLLMDELPAIRIVLTHIIDIV